MARAYVKHERFLLQDAPEFSEAWLHERIAEDPSILGLGELEILDRERRHARAGRLDLLLTDPDGEQGYEVEVQLGATDADHIIRCIEYWDIERRRYPAYEHSAVLVAEDTTSRFLNVMSLLAGSIPLIAIQLNALKVGDGVVLDFVKVLDQTSLRRDDESEGGETVTRSDWVERTGAENMSVVDRILEMINERASPKQQLNYKQQFIGLTDGTRSRNFIWFTPQKKAVRLGMPTSGGAPWQKRLDEAGVHHNLMERGLRVWVTSRDLAVHEALLRELVHRVVGEYQNK